MGGHHKCGCCCCLNSSTTIQHLCQEPVQLVYRIWLDAVYLCCFAAAALLLLLPQLLYNNPTPVPGTCTAGLQDLAGCCVLVLLCCCGAVAVAASTPLQQSNTCARNLYSWFTGSGWMLCVCAALLLRRSTQRRLQLLCKKQ